MGYSSLKSFAQYQILSCSRILSSSSPCSAIKWLTRCSNDRQCSKKSQSLGREGGRSEGKGIELHIFSSFWLDFRFLIKVGRDLTLRRMEDMFSIEWRSELVFFLLISIEQVNSAGKTLFWFPRCDQGQGVFDVANKYWQYLRWSEKMYFAHFLWRWRLVWLLKCWVYIMFWLLFSRLRSDVCFKGKN
jgi:hypothetical protein